MKKSIIVLSVAACFALVYAASKTTTSFSSSEKQVESINQLQNLLIDRHNLAVNDLDTLFANTANLSTAKLTRDSLVATKGLRVTYNATLGGVAIVDSVKSTKGVSATLGVFSGKVSGDSVVAVKGGRFTNLVTCGGIRFGATGIDSISMQDGDADTLIFKFGAKIWKILTVENQ